MSTSSDYLYKEYTIRIVFSKGGGAWYKIFKIVNGKYFNLRQKGWNFMLPERLLSKAKNYIDQFNSQLEAKYQKLFALSKKCDMCGAPYSGEGHNVSDEQHMIEPGLVQCDLCYSHSLGIYL